MSENESSFVVFDYLSEENQKAIDPSCTREGLKNWDVCFLSQSPSGLSKNTVRKNSNTKVLFRINFKRYGKPV